jgi:parvulin-like peptidyl-prolyl isomerase
MGTIHRGKRHEAVEKALFETEPGNITDIIFSHDAYGIYLVTSYTPVRYYKYEEVKNQIEAILRTKKIEKIKEKFLRRLRIKANIRVYKDSIKACLDTTIAPNNRVLAKVNDRAIDWNDVEQKKRSLHEWRFGPVKLTKSKEVEGILNTLIDESLQVEWAIKKKHFLNDAYFVTVKELIEILLSHAMYQKVLSTVQIDSQEVKDYYEEHRNDYYNEESVKSRELVVGSITLANELREILVADPEQFDSLAREHSIAYTKRYGGELDWIKRGEKSQKFEKIAFSLQPGTISEIFSEVEDTYAIITVEKYIPEGISPFEDIKVELTNYLYSTKRDKTIRDFLTKIEEEADIKKFVEIPERKK